MCPDIQSLFKFAVAKHFEGTRVETGLSGQQYFVFSHRFIRKFDVRVSNLTWILMKASRRLNNVAFKVEYFQNARDFEILTR